MNEWVPHPLHGVANGDYVSPAYIYAWNEAIETAISAVNHEKPFMAVSNEDGMGGYINGVGYIGKPETFKYLLDKDSLIKALEFLLAKGDRE